MSTRAVGTGMVSFGLVNIPIKIYSANKSDARVGFRQLHAQCKSLMETRHHCPKCDLIVDKADQVKGHEVSKGVFVTFTSEEVKDAAESTAHAIAITEFVPANTVNPALFHRMEYLVPDRGGTRGYWLLQKALKKTRLVGVAQYSTRGRAYLVMIMALNDGLVMQVCRFNEEVRPLSTMDIPDAPQIGRDELDLAVQLVRKSAKKVFNVDRFKDPVTERLNEMVEEKLKGTEVTSIQQLPPVPRRQADLMDALKQSLQDDKKVLPLRRKKRRKSKKRG